MADKIRVPNCAAGQAKTQDWQDTLYLLTASKAGYDDILWERLYADAPDNGDAPNITGGVFEMNGAFYECAAGEEISGIDEKNIEKFDGSEVFVYAVLVPGPPPTVHFEYRLARPAFIPAKGGWYSGNDRAVLIFYKSAQHGYLFKLTIPPTEIIPQYPLPDNPPTGNPTQNLIYESTDTLTEPYRTIVGGKALRRGWYYVQVRGGQGGKGGEGGGVHKAWGYSGVDGNQGADGAQGILSAGYFKIDFSPSREVRIVTWVLGGNGVVGLQGEACDGKGHGYSGAEGGKGGWGYTGNGDEEREDTETDREISRITREDGEKEGTYYGYQDGQNNTYIHQEDWEKGAPLEYQNAYKGAYKDAWTEGRNDFLETMTENGIADGKSDALAETGYDLHPPDLNGDELGEGNYSTGYDTGYNTAVNEGPAATGEKDGKDTGDDAGYDDGYVKGFNHGSAYTDADLWILEYVTNKVYFPPFPPIWCRQEITEGYAAGFNIGNAILIAQAALDSAIVTRDARAVALNAAQQTLDAAQAAYIPAQDAYTIALHILEDAQVALDNAQTAYDNWPTSANQQALAAAQTAYNNALRVYNDALQPYNDALQALNAAQSAYNTALQAYNSAQTAVNVRQNLLNGLKNQDISGHTASWQSGYRTGKDDFPGITVISPHPNNGEYTNAYAAAYEANYIAQWIAVFFEGLIDGYAEKTTGGEEPVEKTSFGDGVAGAGGANGDWHSSGRGQGGNGGKGGLFGPGIEELPAGISTSRFCTGGTGGKGGDGGRLNKWRRKCCGGGGGGGGGGGQSFFSEFITHPVPITTEKKSGYLSIDLCLL
jgi:hypothetical protein